MVSLRDQTILALRQQVAELVKERDEAQEILSPGRLYRLNDGQEIPTTLVERARWVVAALNSESQAGDEARAEAARTYKVLELERQARQQHEDELKAERDRLRALLREAKGPLDPELIARIDAALEGRDG